MNTIERNKKVLLLSGPQFYDERRPLTGRFTAELERVDPLGPAIVAAFLREFKLEPIWRTMEPGKVGSLEGLIENVGLVAASSRFYDTVLIQEGIRLANKHGTPTIVGGYRATAYPEDFSQATAIVRGEAEPVLGQVLEDLMGGHSQGVYDARTTPFDMGDYVWPDRSVLPRPPRGLERVLKHGIEFERGCPYACAYCSICNLQGRTVRTRGVDDIIAEIESMKLKRGDFLFPADANIAAIPKDDLREILLYIKTAGLRFFAEATIDTWFRAWESGDQDILKLMSPKEDGGGCWSLLYGIDDPANPHLRYKQRALLERAAPVMRELGIPFYLSLILGLDNHTYPDTFFQVRSFLEELPVAFSFLHIATPYQGTDWGDQVYTEGRVFETNSVNFNHRRVVFHPKGMSVDQLWQGYLWLLRRLYGASQEYETVRKNFRGLLENPTLGLFLYGILWRAESYFAYREHQARGYVNPQVQKELDAGYKDFKSRKV